VCAAAGLRLARLGAAIVGVVIDYCDRHPRADAPTRPKRLRPHPGATPPPRRWHPLRGPGEKQAVMTEPSGVRVMSPLAADPRGFCARLPVLGRF
jgi:hypothetical protein